MMIRCLFSKFFVILLLNTIKSTQDSTKNKNYADSKERLIFDDAQLKDPKDCLELYKENLDTIFDKWYLNNRIFTNKKENTKINIFDYMKERVIEKLKKLHNQKDITISELSKQKSVMEIFEYFTKEHEGFLQSCEELVSENIFTHPLDKQQIKKIKQTFKYNLMINLNNFKDESKLSENDEFIDLEELFAKKIIDIAKNGPFEKNSYEKNILEILKYFLYTFENLEIFKKKNNKHRFISIKSIISELVKINNFENSQKFFDDISKIFTNFKEKLATKKSKEIKEFVNFEIEKILGLKNFCIFYDDKNKSLEENACRKVRTYVLFEILINLMDLVSSDKEDYELAFESARELAHNIFLYSLDNFVFESNLTAYIDNVVKQGNDNNVGIIKEINKDLFRDILTPRFIINNDEIYVREVGTDPKAGKVQNVKGGVMGFLGQVTGYFGNYLYDVKEKAKNVIFNKDFTDVMNLTDYEQKEREWAYEYVKNKRVDDFLDLKKYDSNLKVIDVKRKHYYNLFRIKTNDVIKETFFKMKVNLQAFNSVDKLMMLLEILDTCNNQPDIKFKNIFFEEVNFSNISGNSNIIDDKLKGLQNSEYFNLFGTVPYDKVKEKIWELKSVEELENTFETKKKPLGANKQDIVFYVLLGLSVTSLILGVKIFYLLTETDEKPRNRKVRR